MATERRLRVAVTTRAVAPWHGRGGLERHVNDLVSHLVVQGVHVTLLAPPPHAGSNLPSPWPADAVRVVHVPYATFPGAGRRGTTILDRVTAYPLFGWRVGRSAARLVREGAIDLVHGLGASVLGYALAKRRDPRLCPLVLNPQGLEEFGATDPGAAGLKRYAYWPLQQAVRACASQADSVLATDRALIPAVITHLNVPQARVALVPNAIDLGRCDGMASAADGLRARRSRGWTDDSIVFLSVGRIERNKGFHVLLEALTQLADLAVDWRWVLVGSGPFSPTLDERIRRSGLGWRVARHEGLSDSDLHAWYEAADVFVHPTLYEGSSLVTLEAMAHRRPVLATWAGGLPDKVVPGKTGWLVEPGNADALARGLRDAVGSRSQWNEFGTAGRAVAEQTFAWPRIAADLVGLYQQLADNHVRRTERRK